jgi:hypothetical protein
MTGGERTCDHGLAAEEAAAVAAVLAGAEAEQVVAAGWAVSAAEAVAGWAVSAAEEVAGGAALAAGGAGLVVGLAAVVAVAVVAVAG